MRIIKHFDELNTIELYNIINLRERVFVVEQKCAYLDVDFHDVNSWHLMCYSSNILAGYLRILPPNTTYTEPSIGRVVVDEKHRKSGLGRKMMIEAIQFINEKYTGAPIKIGAQVYLNDFYKSLGFRNIGKEYMEDGILHIGMIL